MSHVILECYVKNSNLKGKILLVNNILGVVGNSAQGTAENAPSPSSNKVCEIPYKS